MWQQNPFRLDHNTSSTQPARLLKEHSEPLQFLFSRGDSPNYFSLNNLISSSSSSAAASAASARSGNPELDWQRIAGLVQSPASANSEGSSTSTPDQCPASPALTFCEMPSSRNHGGCSNSVSEMLQKHNGNAWTLPNIPPETQGGPSRVSSDCGSLRWPGAQSLNTAIEAPGASPLFSEECWNSLIDVPGTSGYMVAQPLASTIPPQLVDQPQKPRGHCSSVYEGDHHPVKKEEEYFLGGRNGLVIDESVLSLHHHQRSNGSGAAPSTSKIGSFMDLLRQSDRPISDATAAASQLSQLLSCSQEAPEMWMAHSNRFPAILSEVLPSSSSGGSGGGNCSETLEFMNKRKLFECCSASDADVQGSGSSAVHHHGPMKQQDEDEASHDRVAGGAAPPPNDNSEMFSKKPRIENSNFPFKMQVRKEKLGERISALQQLVSPFGKTDTASVLLEAIGYIKFLHEQVQVLSSPYMKSSGSSKIRHNEHGDEGKQELRSRGLCLVPISSTLQLANDNGADYWTPTLHGGLK